MQDDTKVIITVVLGIFIVVMSLIYTLVQANQQSQELAKTCITSGNTWIYSTCISNSTKELK